MLNPIKVLPYSRKNPLEMREKGKGKRRYEEEREKVDEISLLLLLPSSSLLPELNTFSFFSFPLLPGSGNESGFFILPSLFPGRGGNSSFPVFLGSAQKGHLPKPLKCPWSEKYFWAFQGNTQRPLGEPMQKYTFFLPNSNSDCIFLSEKRKKSTYNTHWREQKNEKAPDGRSVGPPLFPFLPPLFPSSAHGLNFKTDSQEFLL